MRFEIVEQSGAWIVRRDGDELSRFDAQAKSLEDVAVRMREADRSKAASLVMRYEPRES